MKDTAEEIFIRGIDLANDLQDVASFLDTSDRDRLTYLQRVIPEESGFARVADSGGRACGWVLCHTQYRRDIGWIPDSESEWMHNGRQGYLENIAVAPLWQGRGVGRLLLESVCEEARKVGKETLWLHVREANRGAIRLYERYGWIAQGSVTPEWMDGVQMRVYSKDLL